MEPLFRLTLVRPPVEQDPANPSIDLTQDTAFQKALAEAAQAENPRPALDRVARAFVASADFIGSPEKSPLGRKTRLFSLALDRLEKMANFSRNKVVNAVQEAFDMAPGALVKSQDYADTLKNLRDSLLAIKQLQEEHKRPIEALTTQLRDLEMIQKLVDNQGFPANAAELRRFRRRSLMLPVALNLTSVLSTRDYEAQRRAEYEKLEAERKQRADALFDRHQVLHQAIAELTGLGKEHFQVTPQSEHPGSPTPDDLGPRAVAAQQLKYYQKLSDLNLGQIKAAAERGPTVDPLTIQGIAGANSAAELAKSLVAGAPQSPVGSPPLAPFSPVGFRLKPGAVEALSEPVRKALEERHIPLAEMPLDGLTERLQTEMEDTGRELTEMYAQPARRGIRRVGSTLVAISQPVVSAWQPASGAGMLSAPPPLPAAASVPTSRGKVAPPVIADLLIVKQQLVGYEAADVAHIENVLKGERKFREHTTRRETEEFTFRETETTSSEERELESTDRFEMTRETQTTIKEDAALKAGLNISGKYGPVVEFSASAEGSTSRSKEEATRSASNFSQEVTERSAIKITERVLERESLRVTNEVIEKNTHELSNVGGTGHISGVYQWVNKVYQAQMFNYGQRTMFDFMVSEPAAFLIAAMNSAASDANELVKPPEFTLTPNQISDVIGSSGYYGTYVRIYGATDVTPPPELYKTKALDFKAGGGDNKTNYNHSAVITIDEGYRAVSGSVAAVLNIWESDYSVDLALGSRVHRLSSGSWVWTTNLDDERDSLPFALDTFHVSQVAAAVEVKCQRTDRAMEKWRFETHAKLTTAYKARLSEYEEKLSALQLQQGVAIRGKNPFINLEMMNDELKKNCISILTDQHYDLFDAIETSPANGLPQIDLSEADAEGVYVRFFEQAFEWEHMTWVTYPYFWGRKNQWDERVAFEDVDPLFNQFLKAGFCRVSVPARPGFEGAIDHFLTYGELWDGGPLPAISSPLYLPIADEIAERLDQPGDEIPQGDPWMVRIPTTLVHLRADDQLPRWEQDENGEWVEATPPAIVAAGNGGDGISAKADKEDRKVVKKVVGPQ